MSVKSIKAHLFGSDYIVHPCGLAFADEIMPEDQGGCLALQALEQ